MKDFGGKLAVITGTGSGMGRELARQLVAEGAHVAMCDVMEEQLAETLTMCEAERAQGVRVTSHLCDVADEAQVIAFKDAVARQHETDEINLLFNNAGIGGGGSFLLEAREDWERTFGICWYGVYYCTRSFMPMLLHADEGHIVNTSSVNGFWACLGPDSPHTAYSSAKFAVKGFSEALSVDLRLNAPHVKVSVVMPGHIGTSIAINSGRVLGHADPLEMPQDQIDELRARYAQRGVSLDEISDDQIRALVKQQGIDFRDNAPMSAAEAAGVILDGVREERWRILVGADAEALDRRVRDNPEVAYSAEFIEQLRKEPGVDWRLG